MEPFFPKPGGTFQIANATSASSGTEIDTGCDQVALFNSSASAIAFVRVTHFPGNDLSTAVSASATTDMPVGPGAQIRISVGYGLKKISAIASAADGILYVTPGHGN